MAIRCMKLKTKLKTGLRAAMAIAINQMMTHRKMNNEQENKTF